MTGPAIETIAGGIHRITMPLPWALDHVHCYAIEDPGGWTIVDCGLGTPGTVRRWREALERLGSPPVSRVVLTHYHPDHLGASRALVDLTGAAEVVQGRFDADLSRRTWGDEADPEAFRRYLLANGMPPGEAGRSVDEEGGTPVDLARPTRLVDEGDTIELAGERYAVLVLPGHADGHIALLAERTGVMFGGDVLLLEITPNVGRWEDTLPDPLGRYLDTLRRIEDIDPAVVYPGHRGVVADPARRAVEIRLHHVERLDVHEQALRAGAGTAYEVGRFVWGDALGLHERRFALVEAISHLERLEVEGRAAQVEPGRWRAAA